MKSEGRLLISGTKGYIVAEHQIWKTSYFEVHHENPNDVEKYSDRFWAMVCYENMIFIYDKRK